MDRIAEEVRTIDGHPAGLHHYRVAAAVYIIDDTAGVEYFAVPCLRAPVTPTARH